MMSGTDFMTMQIYFIACRLYNHEKGPQNVGKESIKN